MKFRGLLPLLALLLVAGVVNAVRTEQNASVNFTVSVAEFIDVAISPPMISFGSLDPTQTAIASTPINVTSTENSNVNINISVYGTDFVSGQNSFSITNLRMLSKATMPNQDEFGDEDVITTTEKMCTSTVFSTTGYECYNVPRNTTRLLWFRLTIPGGTLAGTYQTTLTIKAKKA